MSINPEIWRGAYIQSFHSRDNVFQEMERINKTFFKPLLAQDIQGKVIDKYV